MVSPSINQVNVLSYDYRGYGLHPGVPTEASCYADVEGAYDLLTKEFKIPPSRIILYTIIIIIISTLSAFSTSKCMHILTARLVLFIFTPLVSPSTPNPDTVGRLAPGRRVIWASAYAHSREPKADPRRGSVPPCSAGACPVGI